MVEIGSPDASDEERMSQSLRGILGRQRLKKTAKVDETKLVWRISPEVAPVEIGSIPEETNPLVETGSHTP